MIYDCFTFYNELEVLDIRLHELDRVVDKFVLLESTVTHTNNPKPLYYQLNKSRYKKFHKKIIHIILDDCPDVSNPWVLERYQYTELIRGLKNCKPNDTILHGPMDEIPRAEKVLEWKDKPGDVKMFSMKLFHYYLNFMEDGKGEWIGTPMFKFKVLKKIKDIYFTRYIKNHVIVPDGGWHFSYMGGVKRIQQKMSSMAHQEYNNDKYNTPEKIKRAILEGKDPVGHGTRFKIVDVKYLPLYVSENKKKFEKMILKKSKTPKIILKIKIFMWDFNHQLRVKFLRKLKRKISK